jgi:WD40 repeat protein
MYALTFSPDGKILAAAGEDGRVRLINTVDGMLTKEFVPVPMKGVQPSDAAPQRTARAK